MVREPRHKPVSTRTFTITLKPRPKNALVSPLVQNGSFSGVVAWGGAALAGAVMRASPFGAVLLKAGLLGQGLEVVLGRGGPAEDAALGGDHGHAGPLELGEV